LDAINPITRSAAWVRASALRARIRELPHPADEPIVTIDGPDALRILLVGTGPAAGWGETSWSSTLAGQLARLVAERTGRGVTMEVVANSDMSAGSAPGFIAHHDLSGYAAVVVSLGFNEALDLVYPGVFAGGLATLLDALGLGGATVVTLGVPPATSLPHLSERFSTAVDNHAGTLAVAAVEVADPYVPLGSEGWAASIADVLVPGL
jgi:hypothetical protein